VAQWWGIEPSFANSIHGSASRDRASISRFKTPACCAATLIPCPKAGLNRQIASPSGSKRSGNRSSASKCLRMLQGNPNVRGRVTGHQLGPKAPVLLRVGRNIVSHIEGSRFALLKTINCKFLVANAKILFQSVKSAIRRAIRKSTFVRKASRYRLVRECPSGLCGTLRSAIYAMSSPSY
jgi:hypothetical protein